MVSQEIKNDDWVEKLNPDVRKLYKEGKLKDLPQTFLENAHVVFQRRLRKDAVVPQDAVSPENPPKARYEEGDYEKTDEARYVVSDQKLGSGGFGDVHDAYDLRFEMFVAVKQLKLPKNIDLFDRDELEDSIEREAKTQGHLRHKNLPITYDFFWDNGVPTFVMEKFDPKEYSSLQDVSLMTASMITRVLAQISSVEMYCHEKGLYHQDMKPRNMLVDTKGNVKVLDFGLSNWAIRLQPLGTIMYSSPERAGLSSQEYDKLRSEVFTLGTMLYEFVTGKVLYDFPNDDSGSMALTRVYEMPQLTQEERELFLKKAAEKGFDSDKLLVVLEKSHSRDPHGRFESPEAFTLAVSEVLINPATASS